MPDSIFDHGVQWGQFTSTYFDNNSPNDDRDRIHALSALICEVDKAQDAGRKWLTLTEIRQALIDGWYEAYDPKETPTDGPAN